MTTEKAEFIQISMHHPNVKHNEPNKHHEFGYHWKTKPNTKGNNAGVQMIWNRKIVDSNDRIQTPFFDNEW